MKALLHKNNYKNSAKHYALNLRTSARKNKLWIIALVVITICSLSEAEAQNNVGIGTTSPNPKAILELQATDKGLLVPRLTATEMNAIVAPPNGLLIYNTNDNCFNYFNTATITWKSMCNVSGISNSGDTVVINLLKADSIFANYLTVNNAFIKNLFATYIKADSIYTKLLRADSAFINYIYAHSIKADTIRAGFGSFDSLYVGGQNILQTITDSIAMQAWLTKGNMATNNYKLGTLNARDLHIYAGGLERMSIMQGTGNIGIGQTLPSAKLDVLGNMQFSGDLKPAGLPGVAGQYLTSAGLGVAPTWTTITLPATTVSNTYNTITGNLNTTVNGITGASVTLPTANNITDSITAQAWLLKGNAGTTAGTNFIGTTDNVDLIFKRNGLQSGLINQNLSTTSFGLVALNPANTGVSNSAFGSGALTNNTTGYFNTAIGTSSIAFNTTGFFNTATGANALVANTAGSTNTATGANSLLSNTVGNSNTALGESSLLNNTTGSYNIGVGSTALGLNTVGVANTAIGNASLGNTTGTENTAIGSSSGATNATGNYNTYLGSNADATVNSFSKAVAIGYNAKVGASNAMVLGGTGVDAVKVGIGTQTPAQELDVVGNLQFSKALMPNASAGTAGQLLTSAGAGIAPTWINANTLPAPASAWNILGNAGTVAGPNFLGTSDNVDVVFKRNNVQSGLLNTSLGNTSFGVQALSPATTGTENTAIGSGALANVTLGYYNTALGTSALVSNTSGQRNTALGRNSLVSNTTGGWNTAVGESSLASNTSGVENTAVGKRCLVNNTTANFNSAFGETSMESNTTGSQNAAFGQASLNYNTVGGNNTALGNASLFYNTSGSTNVGVGTQSLFRNDGSSNSAVGNQSLFNNSTGNENSSLGSSSGATNTTGNYNTYLGSNADATVNSFSKAVAIGYNAKVGASNAMVLGGTGIDAVNVGINTTTPATSARLDLVSTSSGFAMPRMTSIQRKAIASPIDGLQVIDTDLKGIYIYFGGKWDCVSVPAGSTGYFANTIAPNGYLECNGQAVNRTTYAELFAAIGTVYGVGDGSTTFNVPDLRGEFVRGVDNARGVDAGRAIGTAQTDDFKSHNHQLSSKIIVEGNVGISDVGGGNPAGGWGFTSLTGGSETRPRNVAMLPCIKF